MADGQRALKDRFLTPSTQDKEVVVLTDRGESAAIMASRRLTTALSAEATTILRSSFMGDSPRKLPEVVHDRSEEDAKFVASWIDEMVADGVLRLSASKPKIQGRGRSEIKAGDVMRLSEIRPTPGLPGRRREGITVEHDGVVETRTVGASVVHWYTANIDLPLAEPLLGLRQPAAAVVTGPVTAQMRARRVPGPLGANCSICGACGGCGACGACGLCGGVDFAAAALAIVAVDAALAVTHAAATFEMLRAQA